MTKITAPQLAVLKATRDGEIEHSMLAAHAAGYNPWSAPTGIRRSTIERTLGKGLVVVGPHRQPSFMAKLRLTDAGRRALAELCPDVPRHGAWSGGGSE